MEKLGFSSWCSLDLSWLSVFPHLIFSVYKFQNSIYIYEGPAYKQNFHPYLQVTLSSSKTLSMFMGEMLSLPIFLLMKKRNAAKYA